MSCIAFVGYCIVGGQCLIRLVGIAVEAISPRAHLPLNVWLVGKTVAWYSPINSIVLPVIATLFLAVKKLLHQACV